MKILSSFTHPQVVPNLYECLCSAELKGRYSEECGKQSSSDFHSIFFSTMEVNGAPKQPGYKLSSEYLHLCSAEQRHSYRFGTTWGWVNDDRIFIFGWTVPLSCKPMLYALPWSEHWDGYFLPLYCVVDPADVLEWTPRLWTVQWWSLHCPVKIGIDKGSQIIVRVVSKKHA